MEIRRSHVHLRAGEPHLLTLDEAADQADMLPATLLGYIEDNQGPDLYRLDDELFVTTEDLQGWLAELISSLRTDRLITSRK